jgi:hypothetical protein
MRKTARYYKSHPEAKTKKDAYNKAYNRKPSAVRKRVEVNRANRKAGTYGNGDNLDASHTRRGIRMKPRSVNRGSRSDSAGDHRARGRD